MLHDSPLRERHEQAARSDSERGVAPGSPPGPAERPGAATGHRQAIELEYLPYATPEGVEVCELVASFGSVEVEYAAIRRGAALMDAPQRGTLLVRGKDRREFLQRMLTQDLRTLAPGRAVESFWLNRKGRIDADLLLVELGDRLLVAVDAGAAASAVATLTSFVFSEEIALEDASASWHWLELHGPAAGRSLALAGATSIPALGEAAATTLGGVEVVLVRADLLGEHGWLIAVERARAGEVWDALLAVEDETPSPSGTQRRRRVRPIGWHAYNIARVEAGTPFFQIDFGTANLPHETGILDRRVSFTKGCYLGQEVVARMHSLGKPKQMLVGLRPSRDLLPVAGSQVFERAADGSMGAQVGAVTSSTLAPMLSAAPIAFGMVRAAQAEKGTTLLVNAEGEQCEATVTALRSWPLEPAATERKP